MSTTAPEAVVTTPAAPVQPAAATAPPAATPAAPTGSTPPEPVAPATTPWDDPKAAEAEIKKLRQENAADRTNAKAAAAQEARDELAKTIGKALGLVEDEVVDPAVLTKQIGDEKAATKQARVELAVYRNAAASGGDPVALLDSTSFLKSLDSIDPNDGAAITAAIAAAVTANSRLGAAAPGTVVPAPNPAQGGAAAGAPGLDAAIAAATARGDHLAAINLKQQRHAQSAKP